MISEHSPTEMTMVGNPILKLSTIALLFLGTAKASQASEYGTAEEARAMLNRVVTALKDDKRKALEDFNDGNGGFKDRDLYVLCADASDGTITASPSSNGSNLKDFPPGQKVMKTATEGQIREVDVLVPASWLTQATQKAHLVYEDWRSNLRRRLLGGISRLATGG
jgi:hypothetical protein